VNITIEGQGMNKTIIQLPSKTDTFFISNGNVSNFVLQDLTSDKGGFDLSGGINRYITIQRCLFNETGIAYDYTDVGLIKVNIILNSFTDICIGAPSSLFNYSGMVTNDITISGNRIVITGSNEYFACPYIPLNPVVR
jgi:hypothetical protein